jgi:hypothetical protein
VSVHPQAFKLDLTRALIDLAGCLADIGQLERAITEIGEAIALYASLVGEGAVHLEGELNEAMKRRQHWVATQN